MTIDWKKEVESRKEDLLKDLFDLLRIDSVRDDSKASEDAPVGPGPKKALEAFLAILEQVGKQILLNHKLLMNVFMLVVQVMIKGQVWQLIMR